MSGEQLGQRVLAEQSGIPSDVMRKGRVKPGDFHRFAEITQQLAGVPVYIEPPSGLSIEAIRTRARRMKRQHGIGLLPVLALSQLSRDVEKREDKRPQLSDLRDSAAIEQDADVVCFTYREEYYLSQEEPRQRGEEHDEAFSERHAGWESCLKEVANIAEVIIAKQRMGPIGVEKLSFDPELTRFTDL